MIAAEIIHTCADNICGENTLCADNKQVVDEFLEGKPSSCYCTKIPEKERKNGIAERKDDEDGENELSETLRGRRNFFRDTIMASPWIWSGDNNDLMNINRIRWSDCGCESCSSWITSDGSNPKLHVVVKELGKAILEDSRKNETENIIFLHGFLSSSSLWAETVFPNLSETSEHNNKSYRVFAVDLLGFGRSPKPRNCFYTLKDHLEMIKKCLIKPYQLNSFHIVAHSMGCAIALPLAAKYSTSVKSIVLIAPPYFPCTEENPSLRSLEKLAARRIWPPLLFGSSFMSWYEHLGRCVCFAICRNHKTWEFLLKLVTRKRDLHFVVHDLSRHTHHSAWHTMHNVICGGAKLMDKYLEILKMSKVKIHVIQGNRDQIVPLECSINLIGKVPNAKINIIDNADHISVIFGREKQLTRDLGYVWESTS